MTISRDLANIVPTITTSGGNVGIGTASPTSGFKLDVQATTARNRLESTTGTNTVESRLVNTGGTFYTALDNSAGSNFASAYAGILWHSGNYPIVFGSNNAEAMRLKPDGIVVLKGGSTAATGTGITFPATQSASSNANTLDDYEEGNFTPTLAEGSSSTTYTTQGGFYIKIGRMVYINLQLDCATTSASGSIIGIGGLPFTCGNTNNTGWCAISSGFNSSFNTNAGDSYVVYPTTAIVRVYANDGNYRSPSAGGINLNGSICLSGCYYID